MKIEILKEAPTMPDGPDAFVTVSERAVSGAVFAVHFWMNRETKGLGPFYEPWDTGLGRYASENDVLPEVVGMAIDNELPVYVRPELLESLKAVCQNNEIEWEEK